MDKIRQWAITVSAVSVISGVLISLLPENMAKRYFRIITGIIVIYAAVTPFTGVNSVNFSLDSFLRDNYKVSENMDKYSSSAMLSSAEKAIERLYEKKAQPEKMDIEFECECVIDGEEIRVISIKVYSDEAAETIRLVELWTEEYGFDKAILTFEGEKK